MPRPVHLAGQRLRRRPDKCDAGCRRHKLHITHFRRCRRRKLALSVARPLPTETASLGFGGSPVGGGDKNSRFAFFGCFYVGVVSLPSACASCCRNAGRPQLTAAYSPFLCRLGICPVRAECSLGVYTTTPSPNRAHSGSHAETRGGFPARDIGRVDRVNSLGTQCIVTFGTAQFDEPLAVAAAHHGGNTDFA